MDVPPPFPPAKHKPAPPPNLTHPQALRHPQAKKNRRSTPHPTMLLIKAPSAQARIDDSRYASSGHGNPRSLSRNLKSRHPHKLKHRHVSLPQFPPTSQQGQPSRIHHRRAPPPARPAGNSSSTAPSGHSVAPKTSEPDPSPKMRQFTNRTHRLFCPNLKSSNLFQTQTCPQKRTRPHPK